MRRKGLDFRRAPHLTYRSFNVETDVDRCGNYDAGYFERSPHGGYFVILRVKDCKLTEPDEHGRQYIDWASAQLAPCIRFLSWSRTNMVYGRWRRGQAPGRWLWVQTKPNLTPAAFKAAEAAGDDNPEGWEQKWFDVYWTSPVYWVESGHVYQGTIRTHTDPNAKEAA